MRQILPLVNPFSSPARKPSARYQRDRVRQRPALETLESRALLSLTTINFDNLPEPTAAGKHYDSLGVDFTGATIIAKGDTLSPDFPPHSPPNVVDDRTGPITAKATAGTDWTEVGGYITGNHKIVMEAFQADGTMVGKVSTPGANYIGSGTGLSPNIKLDIKGSDIAYVEFIGNADGGADFTLDDFFFQSQTTILPASLNWNVADGGVDFTYSAADPLPFSVPVDFYWSPTNTFDATDDTPAYVTLLEEGQSPSPIHINPSSLTAPPAGTSYLLAVLDPTQTVLLQSPKDTLPLPYDPTMTVTSKYNGSSDPTTFGRFLAAPGVITDETLTIQLSDSLAALRPYVSTWVGDQALLSTHHVTTGILGSWDGLTYETDPFDPGAYSGQTTLTTQALLGNGTDLLDASDTLDVEPLPDWMKSLQSQAGLTFTPAPGGPNGSETGSYSISGLVTNLSLPIASTIPSDVPIVGGEQVGASAGLGLNLNIPLSVASAPTASGYADVSLTFLNTDIFDEKLVANFSSTSQSGGAIFTVTPTFTLDPETLAANGGFGLTFTVDDSAQLASQSVASRDVVLVVGGVPVTTHFGINITPSYVLKIQATVTDTPTAGISLVPTGTFISFATTAGLQVQAQSGIFVPPTLVSAISPYLSPVLQTLHRLIPSLFPSSVTLPDASLEATLTGTLTVNTQVNYTGGINAVPLAVSMNGVINATSAVDLEFSFPGIGVFLIQILNYNPFPTTFPYKFTILS